MTTLLTYDALASLKSLITGAAWNATGLGTSTVPTVRLAFNDKTQGLEPSVEEVLLYPLEESVQPFALHGDAYRNDVRIKIDVRTYSSLDRHNQVCKEIIRICQNAIRQSPTYIYLIVENFKDYSGDYRNMFRGVITIRYMDVQPFTFV